MEVFMYLGIYLSIFLVCNCIDYIDRYKISETQVHPVPLRKAYGSGACIDFSNPLFQKAMGLMSSLSSNCFWLLI